ncbi:Uncharacterized conserved protein YdgA, DUF945 family [Pseudomonas punonensis]|uniref:Uncharacterized conserved protein YdgA, DUF945 family n=2 Tax=Phytopseudomonas punonensis TaxID=1220495 RepID=A0A1M7FLZ3_9GAMM|nr:Uncharacterized conserved protein YdgA, DUF945 family [Pseudomonas punonensis]
MKKKIVFLAATSVFLVGAWTFAAWNAGERLQSAMQQAMARANTGTGTTVVLKDYNRSLFSSRFSLQVSGLPGAAGQPPVEVEGHFGHGPFPWQRLAAGQLEPVLAAGEVDLPHSTGLLAQLPLSDPAAAIGGAAVLNFDGSLDYRVELPALNGSLPSGQRLEASTISISGTQQPGASDFPLQAQLESLRIVNPQGEVALATKNVTLDAALRKGELGWPLGEVRIKVGELRQLLDSPFGPVPLTARQAQFTLRTSEQAPSLDVSLEVDSGESLKIGQNSIGLISAQLSAERLRVNEIRQVLEIYLQPGEPAGQERDPATRQQFADSLVRVVEEQPSLALQRFSWRTLAGNSGGGASLGLMPSRQSDSPATVREKSVNFTLVPVFSAQLSFSKAALLEAAEAVVQASPRGALAAPADKTLMRNELIRHWIESPLAAGVVWQEQETLESELSFGADHRLRVNGETLPLDDEDHAIIWLLGLLPAVNAVLK